MIKITSVRKKDFVKEQDFCTKSKKPCTPRPPILNWGGFVDFVQKSYSDFLPAEINIFKNLNLWNIKALEKNLWFSKHLSIHFPTLSNLVQKGIILKRWCNVSYIIYLYPQFLWRTLLKLLEYRFFFFLYHPTKTIRSFATAKSAYCLINISVFDDFRWTFLFVHAY